MIDVRAHIAKILKDTPLEILVFGPAIDPPSTDPFIASLQEKRRQLRDALAAEGHSVAFGEDVFDPSLPPPLGDPLLQELVAMRAADAIIVLVGSPGAIAEAIAITNRRELCPKACFYSFVDHKDGLVARHLDYMRAYGLKFHLVSLPDVSACALTTQVLEEIQALQVGKALLF